jgi:hypothetical protein
LERGKVIFHVNVKRCYLIKKARLTCFREALILA